MIYTVTLTPALDRTIHVSGLALDAVNYIHTERTDAGGKGINVSRWIHALGGKSIALCILGGSSGQSIADAMAIEGIEMDMVWIDAPTRTNIKLIDTLQGTHTDINAIGPMADAAALDAIGDRLCTRVEADDIIVLAGKAPPNTPPMLLHDWTAMLNARGAKVLLDLSGETLKSTLGATPYLIKPNQVELEECMGCNLPTQDDLVRAARSLLSTGIRHVVVSLGDQGAIFASQNHIVRTNALQVPVGSTVGAGDAMMAALALGISRQYDWETIARLSVAASAASVMQPGTFPAPRDTILSLLPDVSLNTLQANASQ